MTTRLATTSALLGLLALVMLPALARADAKQDILDRLKARAAELQKLKAAGTVGEVWTGYVEGVAASAPAEAAKFVADENADRKALFELVAKEKGSSVEEAGVAWGKRAFERAAAGEWLKYKDGGWKKKE